MRVFTLLLCCWMTVFLVESRSVVPAALSLSPASLMGQSGTDSVASSSRVIRSCDHSKLGMLLWESCSKQHKRSPFIVNYFISMKYYLLPDKSPEGAVDKRSRDESTGHHPNRKVDEMHFSHSIPSEIIDPLDQYDFLDPTEEDNFPFLSGNGYRELSKRVPVPMAALHPLMEKCCSSGGCVTSDFVSFC